MKCSSQRNCNLEQDAPQDRYRASMKCSSRRNCNRPWRPSRWRRWWSLNEVQFPKELQPVPRRRQWNVDDASMKCSSRKNCNVRDSRGHVARPPASMKCSSRRNCNAKHVRQPSEVHCASMKCSSRRNCNLGRQSILPARSEQASMKCSSQRNCNKPRQSGRQRTPSLNEVQLLRELQLRQIMQHWQRYGPQ